MQKPARYFCSQSRTHYIANNVSNGRLEAFGQKFKNIDAICNEVAITTPVIAGLAVGVGFVVLLSMLFSQPPSFEPRISEEQAIEFAKAEVAKNRWFFDFPEGASVSVLDFNETNYYPESQFLQQDRPLPLVLLFQDDTIKDLNGALSFTLSMCEENINFWYCEFVQSLHNNASLDRQGTLAYFVQFYWSNDNQDHTELFIVDAVYGSVIATTIYQTPVLELENVKGELQALEVRLTSEQALSIATDDLDGRNIEADNLHVQYDRYERHASIDEFYAKGHSLPLVFIHESGNIIFVEDSQPTTGYYCNSPNMPYCAFLPPYNLDSRNRLVYGVDLMWIQGSGIYAVDATNGEIIDSPYLKSEAPRRT